MTTTSHTELAAHMALVLTYANQMASSPRNEVLLNAQWKRIEGSARKLAALESPERVPGEHRPGCDALGGYGHGVGPCSCAATPPTAPAQDAQGELGYATRLACAIWGKHYRDHAPNWKPLPDLVGVLTQIDNMVAGLFSATPSSQAENHFADADKMVDRPLYCGSGHCSCIECHFPVTKESTNGL